MSIIILTLATLSLSGMLGAFYMRGRSSRRMARRSAKSDFLFWVGLASFAASSTWPLERLGREYFAVHQVEFLALRIVAPMLIALSRPGMVLVRGSPGRLRDRVIRPAVSLPLLRHARRVIQRPASVLLLYLASLFLWAIPAFQDAALTNAAVALLLHFSLFASGLLFWSRIVDARTGPRAISHGVRLMMLWLAILGQIAVGAATALKSTVWYPAYGDGLSDEVLGGVLLWIPASIVTLLAILLVIHSWGRHETRLDLRRRTWSPSNSAILLYPETAQSLRAIAAPRNRRVALGLIAFVLFVFLATLAQGIGYRLS
jgi:putative membrane protein